MGSHTDRRSFLVIISVFSLIAVITYLIYLFAQGYRLTFQNGGPDLKATGLLSVTSHPKSASVYVNGRLITATDDTINLSPGDYHLRIVKDGYFPWEKRIKIKKEIVFQTDAELFRSTPDLKPLTITGAINPVSSPDGNLILYSVASASAAIDNGLYLIQVTEGPLPLNRNSPKKISPNFPEISWSKFRFFFSPNSRLALASATSPNLNFLLPLDSPITSKNLGDVSSELNTIRQQWERQNQELIQSKVEKIPAILHSLIATDSAQNIVFSSDDTKILYLVRHPARLPDHFFDPPPAQSTQTQTRNLEPNNYYIYDLRDDTNFLIGDNHQISPPLWLPNSHNLIFVENHEIKTIESDSTNKTTLYAGKFDENLIIPWNDGNRLVTLISPYPGAPHNLYSISLR